MTRRPAIALACAVLAFCVVLGGCGGGGGGQEKNLDLQIGDLEPLTGSAAQFGPAGRKATEVAVAQIRRAIREAGVDDTVTIRHEDDQADARAGIQAARRLVENGSSCIVGALNSLVTLPVARFVTIPEHVLLISPAATGDEISGLKDQDLVNRLAAPDRLQGVALAAVIESDLGHASGRTVNIGARNDPYGNDLVNAFVGAWQKRGGIVGQKVLYDPLRGTSASQARRIVSGRPDAFLIIDYADTYGRVGRSLVKTGKWQADRTYANDGLGFNDEPRIAGRAATEGLTGALSGSPAPSGAADAFDKLFTRSAPKSVQHHSFDAHYFDSTILCYLAAVAAGSTDGKKMADEVRGISGPPGQKHTWQQLPAAIKALRAGHDIDYQGASSAIDLDAAGDPTSGVYDLYRYRGGKLDVFGQIAIPPQ